MTEREALLDAILDNPEDDTLRLVYADWLEENAGTVECPQCEGRRKLGSRVNRHHIKGSTNLTGYRTSWTRHKDCPACSGSGRVSKGFAERAEFIRVQVELARMPSGHCHAELESKRCDQIVGYSKAHWCKPCLLRVREQQLLDTSIIIDERGKLQPRCLWAGKCIVLDKWEFSRGFVSAITCSCADFLRHAAAIWREQPVTAVSLTDVEPIDYETDDGAPWAWGNGERISNGLPDVLFRLQLKKNKGWNGRPTRELCISQLSEVLVEYGKARARAARGTVGVGT